MISLNGITKKLIANFSYGKKSSDCGITCKTEKTNTKHIL